MWQSLSRKLSVSSCLVLLLEPKYLEVQLDYCTTSICAQLPTTVYTVRKHELHCPQPWRTRVPVPGIMSPCQV